ncbi:MAG: hypothetical protein WC263_03605 [Candidatus Micrarchaeia archaeon]|jgi:hypothetical protein
MNYFKEHFLRGSGNLREALLHVRFIKRIAVLHEEIPNASRRHKMKHHHMQRLHERMQNAPEGQQHKFKMHLDRAQLECASLLSRKDSMASEFEAHRSEVLNGRLYRRALALASPFIYNACKAAARIFGFAAIASLVATVPTGLLGRFTGSGATAAALLWEIGAFCISGALCLAAGAAEKFFKTIRKLQKHEHKGACPAKPAGQAHAI